MLQENPLYDIFLEIKDCCEKIEELNVDTYKVFPPIEEDMLKEWELKNNVKLPKEYFYWLLLSNGLDVGFNGELYPMCKTDAVDLPNYENYLEIGQYIGDGSMLLIDKVGNFYTFDHCFGLEKSSFKEFLKKHILGNLYDEMNYSPLNSKLFEVGVSLLQEKGH